MRKKIVIFIVLLLFELVHPIPSHADSNYTVSLDTTYTISEDGVTHAVFKGNVENATDQLFASEYTLQVGFEHLQNISASDGRGEIIPQIKQIQSGYSITLPFRQKAVGLGKSIDFLLTFDTPDIAKHIGSVWEITIPGIANQTDFTSFNVHLHVPSSFGKPVYIKPEQPENASSVADAALDFDKNSLGSSGISAAFGKQQTYHFILHYHLKNDNLFPVSQEIALPPASNYQDVSLQNINPKPQNIRVDNDGNWLAQYRLFPSKKIDVTAKGNVTVFQSPQKEILLGHEKKIYLQQQPYWETMNPDIQKLAKDLKTPQAIYDYVVHHLQYDFTRTAGIQERVGALEVLRNPSSAVCLEFTDLFIAIARAAGIPAREIDGFAHTENQRQRPVSLEKDILHAWPEYYDVEKNMWIMVDPTWEHTTKGTDYFHSLDFDHVTFVIKGEKSTQPLPAGGYKTSDSEKDVLISFSDDNPLQPPQMTVEFTNGILIFRNISQRIVFPQEVFIKAQSLSPRSQILHTIAIPPFGYYDLVVPFHATPFLTKGSDIITIQVAGNTITRTISIYPIFFEKKYIITGGVIIAVFCFIIFVIAARARRLPFFR